MKRFGLIGYPLTHSFSKEFFIKKFEKEGLDCVYENFEVSDINSFPLLIQQNPDLCGLNVTIPYKEQIIPFLDELDNDAREIGAVNTIRFHQNKLIGYNTDVHGFTESIKPLLAPHHKKALILGTGGAAKAVEWSLHKLGITCLSVSRNPQDDQQVAYADLKQPLFPEYKVIINTTPLGMNPNNKNHPPIPYFLISPQHIMYDLVYNPSLTTFLKKGKEKGATIKNGLDMLQIQALKSWEIWNENIT